MGIEFDRPSGAGSAFGAAFGRMLLWMLGILLLIHLITWFGPKPDGSPAVPGWAEPLVWALFVVPVIPAMIAGAARLQGREKWRPVLLGVTFGALTPFFGISSVIATIVLIGGSLNIGPQDESISAIMILSTLFSTSIVLAVGTALIRYNSLRKY